MNTDQSSESSDWIGTPAAVFAAIVLAICSIGGLAWSVNRTMAHDSMSTTRELTDSKMQPDQDLVSVQAPEPSRLNVVRLVDLNAANAAELELLPRIGPALAGRIIADREVHGWFDSIDDLQRVSGIGPKTVEKIKAFAMITESNDSKPD